ncbi:MAG: glycoside hydrolase [Bacteroidota bacterium]|nr:glycoside hydrolase [Bacteroidota bacterium]
MRRAVLCTLLLLSLYAEDTLAQENPKNFNVIGYYAGKASMIDSFHLEKLDRFIYCFAHLNANQIALSNTNDTAALQKAVELKNTKYPNLKVMVSMGGWTGCSTCSEVFQSDKGRKEFAQSVSSLIKSFSLDGFDLDWEYPVIPGPPNQPFSPNDKNNLTQLLKILRETLGPKKEISFTAGGFTNFIEHAVDWKAVMPYVNRVNVMTYDMVTGYSTETGHHTALFSNSKQKESIQHAIQMLTTLQVHNSKIVIGAAFYARAWENVTKNNNGLYQKGDFKMAIPYKDIESNFPSDSGFVYHWDNISKAPYLYSAHKKWFVTYDDSKSVRLKTLYALQHHLNGIMFWQLGDDRTDSKALLDVIDEIRKKYHRM